MWNSIVVFQLLSLSINLSLKLFNKRFISTARGHVFSKTQFTQSEKKMALQNEKSNQAEQVCCKRGAAEAEGGKQLPHLRTSKKRFP